MKMKKLDKFIPIALKAAETNLSEAGKIPKEYNAYISSFGAMVRSGLKPAIAFYESKSADSAQDRRKLTKALLKVVTSYRGDDGNYKTLMEYVLKSNNSSGLVKKDILDAVAALKLAIRTFEMSDKKGA